MQDFRNDETSAQQEKMHGFYKLRSMLHSVSDSVFSALPELHLRGMIIITYHDR